MWLRPFQFSDSCAIGTSPARLAAALASSPPSSGMSMMSPAMVTGPTPGGKASTSARRFDWKVLALGLQGSAPSVNLASAQFALENASAEGLLTAMVAAARRLKAEGELDLAESFGMWVEGVLGLRLGVRLPSMTELMEEPPMLAETLDEWAEGKFRLGQMKGLECFI